MSEKSELSNSIAIIGMAGRFPEAASVSEFWENLCNGVDSVTEIPEDRLEPADTHLFKDNVNYVKRAAVVDGADEFDAEFFDIFPGKAVSMDPQHRLFIECCWHAIEDAGYSPADHNHSIGVFAGCYMNTYLLDALKKNPSVVHELADVFHGGSFQNEIGFEKDYLATQVSYYLDLHGPSLTIQTACSTSLVAIASACQSLVNGEADMALAGAATLRFPQQRGYLYEEGGMMSKTGRCSVFDKSADGTLFGNGVAAVLLKPLKAAQSDGDEIYAVIRGWGLNNDGRRKAGYTAPSPDGQIEAIERAQTMAGISGDTISMVEAHGTGTPLGDPIEVEALSRVFQKNNPHKQYCALGSVKSNIGHLDCTAGIAGLVKTALSLHHRKIPASLHFNEKNPEIDFENSPFFVNTTLLPWDFHSGPRHAALSSFGVGGTNAHVILEEAPLRSAQAEEYESTVLMTFSARGSLALEQQVSNLKRHVENYPALEIASIAKTLNTGRSVFAQKHYLVAGSRKEAIEKLKNFSSETIDFTDKPRSGENVCFMFPGQGAQHVLMGKDFFAREPVFRRAFEVCSEILQPHLEESLQDLLFEGNPTSTSWQDKITQTRYAQPLISAISYSLAQLWISWGVNPTSVIGHSVGEFMAGSLSGIFSIEDALTLVAVRGQLMQGLPRGRMIAVSANAEFLEPHLNQVDIAASNSPRLTVLSGSSSDISEIEHKLGEMEIVTQKIHTSHAFHSSMMDPILEDFRSKLSLVKLNEPKIPMVSTVTGTWLGNEEACSPDYWAANIRKPVRFSEGMLTLECVQSGYLLEVGPGQTLSRLAQQHSGIREKHTVMTSCSHPKSELKDLEVCYDSAGKFWKYDYPINIGLVGDSSNVLRARLPGYPFQRKRFWFSTAEADYDPTRVAPDNTGQKPHTSSQDQEVSSHNAENVQNLVDRQLELMREQLKALQSERQS
ncbi:MAG: type I polyketide synthase [Granulosicoccus sp.]